MQTLADLLDRNARLHADAPAVAGDGRTTTHLEHRERVLRLADSLFAAGLVKGDRFAVLAHNRPEYCELYGVAEASGLILVTLNWRLAVAELVLILADCTPRIVFYESQFAALVSELRDAAVNVRWIAIETGYEPLVGAGRARRPAVPPAPQDIAYIIYTSGTTGRPKGVMLAHAAMLAAAGTIARSASHGPRDRLLAVMPLFHVGAKIESLAVQFMGGATIVRPGFDAVGWFTAVAAERCTVAHLAPVMVKTLCEHPERTRYDLGSLVKIHYGSAPVPPDELRRAIAVFGPIFTQLYGMTEQLLATILLPHQQRLDGEPRDLARLASAGQPYPGTSIRILDDAGRELPVGAVGEVVVRSRGVMSGYWNQPQLTAEVLRDGWIYTGDLGRLDAESYLWIVDRKKDMIISGGENIYSLEVENALAAHPAVLEVAVIGVPDARWGEAVKAFVVLRPGARATADELIAHCRTRIASYKKPQSIEMMGGLPRLATRKVDKNALRAPYWSARERNIA